MRILLLLLSAVCLQAQVSFSGGAAVDQQMERAVQDGLIPGAVVVIGHNGQIVYQKAYGSRALIPHREPMTLDTIFDAASLTKVIATTPSVMRLFEQGQIRINDPVTKYLPEFQGGHSEITIRNLMTHFSGLRPDLDLKPAWSGYETGIQRALNDKPAGPPGVKFVYSDINFILMAEIVHRLSGKMLNEYARENFYEPLGMHETMFLPPASLRPRIAPTEINPVTGQPLRGEVHDDTARYMGGVAGNAGVFTTAADLAKFAQMMLDGGQVKGEGEGNGVRLFSAATVEKFTSPQSPPDQPILRGLGWDIDSPYSSNRGELFPIGSYGHTGFTGTSLWIDPFSHSYLIILTNVVHPHRGHSLSSLRSRVATLVAASLGVTAAGVRLTGYNDAIVGPGLHREVEPKGEVLTGLDVLAEDNFAALRGKRIGLITNQTGLSRDGKRNVDLMLAAGVRVTALFSPEHGLNGAEDRENVSDTKDAASGLPVLSLYNGPSRRVDPKMLDECGRSSLRHSGCRRAFLHLLLHHALQHGRSRSKASAILRSGPPQPGHRDACGRSHARSRSRILYRMPRNSGAAWHDFGRAGGHGERRAEAWSRLARGDDARLEPGRLVRFHRPPLGRPVAKYAEPQRGHLVPGNRDAGIFQELLRGARDR